MEITIDTLILDLRDRMARIETKLDTHQTSHDVIDRRLDKLEATQEEHDTRIDANRSEIVTARARVATIGAIGGGVVTVLTLLGDHFWNIIAH